MRTYYTGFNKWKPPQGKKRKLKVMIRHSENRALNAYDGIKNTTKRNPPLIKEQEIVWKTSKYDEGRALAFV